MLMVQKKMVNDFVKNLLATAEANIEENAAAEINKRYAAGGYY
jgi:hypothetical protein